MGVGRKIKRIPREVRPDSEMIKASMSFLFTPYPLSTKYGLLIGDNVQVNWPDGSSEKGVIIQDNDGIYVKFTYKKEPKILTAGLFGFLTCLPFL